MSACRCSGHSALSRFTITDLSRCLRWYTGVQRFRASLWLVYTGSAAIEHREIIDIRGVFVIQCGVPCEVRCKRFDLIEGLVVIEWPAVHTWQVHSGDDFGGGKMMKSKGYCNFFLFEDFVLFASDLYFYILSCNWTRK